MDALKYRPVSQGFFASIFAAGGAASRCGGLRRRLEREFKAVRAALKRIDRATSETWAIRR
jgi:hypothetical protein